MKTQSVSAAHVTPGAENVPAGGSYLEALHLVARLHRRLV